MECVDCLDGTHPAKLRALHLVKELSPAMGLHVNMAKCELCLIFTRAQRGRGGGGGGVVCIVKGHLKFV